MVTREELDKQIAYRSAQLEVAKSRLLDRMEGILFKTLRDDPPQWLVLELRAIAEQEASLQGLLEIRDRFYPLPEAPREKWKGKIY